MEISTSRVVYTVTLGELAEVPGTPYTCWASKSLRDLFEKHPPLDRDVAGRLDEPKIADVKQGLATADDLRFTRFWWEIATEEIAITCDETRKGRKWVPFAKGGRPFFHDILLVVNWGNNGEEIKNHRTVDGRLLSRPQNETFYFREGLAWPLIVSSRRLDFWRLPSGVIFGHKGPCVFTEHRVDDLALLALANSALVAVLHKVLDPIQHAREVGTVACLPISTVAATHASLSTLGQKAHSITREWSTGYETSPQFIKPWLLLVLESLRASGSKASMEATTGHPLARDLAWSNAESTKLTLLPLSVGQTSISELARACVERERSLREQTNAIQRQIDDEVYRLYGISDEDRQLVEVELGKPPESETEETAEATELANGEDATPTGLMPPEEHIRRLIHYLAHQAFRADSDGVVPQLDTYTADGHLERGLAHRVRQQLGEIFGEAALPGVELDLQTSLGKSLDDWLATDFFAYHVGLYRFRPLVWQITSKPRGEAAYSCFVYWHSLDDDTLRKIQEIYLRPTVEGGMRAANLAAMRLSERRASHAPLRELREAERDHQQAEQRHQELQGLVEKIQCLLQPQQLTVASRSAWVSEKVNEIVARGYRPNRDYGVRVNIEPLKQAGIMPAAADRVKG